MIKIQQGAIFLGLIIFGVSLGYGGWFDTADTNKPGRILLKTEPTKVKVWLGDRQLGDETPLVTPALAPGRYTFRFEAEDYELQTLELEVQADVLATKTVAMMAGSRYRKVSKTGELLLSTATDWDCVYDKTTKLLWEVDISDKKYTWDDALNKRPEEANLGELCGHRDWRLPNHQELVSLVKKGSRPTIDQDYFPNTPALGFWSSSSNDNAFDQAWYIDFGDGDNGHGGKHNAGSIRLVRGGQ